MKRNREAQMSAGKELEQNVEQEREVETHRALLIDVVLENIFKHLGYRDLKSCRNVGNTTWLRNSKKAWWPQTKVVLQNCDEQGERITDLLNQTEIISNAANYKIDDFKDNCEHMLRLLDQLGPSIKDLELQSCSIHSVDAFRRLVYTQCPNLQKLVVESITNEIFDTNDIMEPQIYEKPQFGEQLNLKVLEMHESLIPVSWMELLSHFPKLQDLEANVKNNGIFKAISLIRQHDQKMLKLTHIKIFNETPAALVFEDEPIHSVLLDPNLSLECVLIDAEHCQPETIKDILDLHAKSLKDLITYGDESTELNPPQQPLEILEELTIQRCAFSADIFKFTPNVKEVKLDNNKIIFPASITDRNLIVNACKELQLTNTEEADMSHSDFKSFIAAFPNVEIFETGRVYNLRFSNICEHLTKLVTLNISYGSKVDVIGLLGFDPDSIAENENRRANITNLKDLQSFSADSRIMGKNRKGPAMRNGTVLRQELEKLCHLKKFQLKNYQFDGDEKSWETIFEKYSRK